MNKTPVRPETNFPKQNIPYRKINKPFRFGFIIPGNGIVIEQDSNGVLYVSSEGGVGVTDLVAGDNIELTRTDDGKIVVSAVNTVADIAAGQNVSIDIDPETGTAIINSVIDGETNEHYQGVFDNTDELIAYDNEPEEGDYGLVKNVTYSDGGADNWNGQYKYCFYIGGVWTVVDQMLTFTDNIELIKKFFSVGGSSPVIYLHKVARTGDFNDLRNVPIVATPEVTVEGTTVTATCATEGAEIYYTTDGSMPHVTGTKYTGPVTVAQATTFRFVAIKNGMINSEEALISAGFLIIEPVISMDYTTGEISIENPNNYGLVYYTTDGSAPTTGSSLYSGPFIFDPGLNRQTTINAVVYYNDNYSPVSSKVYSRVFLGPIDTIIPNTGSINIRAICRDVNNNVINDSISKYTIDGDTPDFTDETMPNSLYFNRYGGRHVLKIVGFAPGYFPSQLRTMTIGYDKPSQPSMSFDANTNMLTIGITGNLLNYPAVSLFTDNNNPNFGCHIYYTLDGSSPTTGSALYTGPVNITVSCTVKAIAVCYGTYSSDPAVLDIRMVESPVATINKNTGAVTLSNPNGSGSIYYTLDGSTPTTGSALYDGPFVITESKTVKAIVVIGSSSSPVVEETYQQAETPVIIEAGMNYSTGLYNIEIGLPGIRGDIYYTTDGSTPTYQSELYIGQIQRNIFDGARTYKAIRISDGNVPSQIASLTSGESSVSSPVIRVLDGRAVISLAGNTTDIPLQTNNNVPTMGARIYYTTDGSTPTENSSLFTGTFDVPSGSSMLKAITVCYGRFASQPTVYPLVLSAPVITLLHGQQSGVDVEGKVVIRNPNDFGSIYYTTDGSTPTENSSVFVEGQDYIDIMANTTVKAVIIYRETGLTSSVASLGVKMATLYALPNNPDYGTCQSMSGSTFPADGKKYYFEDSIVSNVIDVNAVPASGYDFVKWQTSNDGNNWQDISGGSLLGVDIGAGGTYYRKAVFEQQAQSTITVIIAASGDGLPGDTEENVAYCIDNAISLYMDENVIYTYDGWTYNAEGNSFYKTFNRSDFGEYVKVHVDPAGWQAAAGSTASVLPGGDSATLEFGNTATLEIIPEAEEIFISLSLTYYE